MNRNTFSTLFRSILLCASITFLTACASTAGQGRAVALYDLSAAVKPSANPEAIASLPPSILLEGIHAPTWLEGPSMQYRLAYSDPDRRHVFAESRWVASPTELIETVLVRNQVAHRGREGVQVCRLRLDMDEFIQRFNQPGSSQALLEVRASLIAPQDARILAGQTLRYVREAGADARSGVAAQAAMVRALSEDLSRWLEKLLQPGSNVAHTCLSAETF